MVTGIILASGFSKRMGKDKLMIEINGFKMIEKVIIECKLSSLDEIIFVYREESIKSIADKYGIKSVYNPNAHLGQSESLKLGIKEAKNSKGFMFLMGDQPFITSAVIDILINEFKSKDFPIVVPYFGGIKGTPAIFSSIFINDIMKITGDKGARDIIKANPEKVNKVYINNLRMGIDIDTEEDLKKYI